MCGLLCYHKPEEHNHETEGLWEDFKGLTIYIRKDFNPLYILAPT
jgi:hypothetical protein